MDELAMSTPNFELSIIMPCLNEAETLGTCIEKAKRFLASSGVQGEVVIGDNGSTDGSQKIATDLGARVVSVPIRGYGAACYYAAQASHGRYLIMGDSDDSYDFLNLMPFVEALRKGNGLVMGNRFKGGIQPGAMPFKNRWLGNPALSGIGRLFFKSPIGDFHCGLRGFSKDAFEKMNLQSMGMEFASEMVIKAHLLGVQITEVPTTLSPDGRSRPPHLRPWRDGWRHLRLMLLFSPRWLFLYPGLALVFAGLAMGAWITFGRPIVGGAGFDVNTLVYCAASVLIGFQSALFSLFTKSYAIQEGILPEDPRMNRFSKQFSLELGLISGAILVALGIAGSLYGVEIWKQAGFGALNPSQTLRVIVPSAMAIAIGFQTILSSFFLSILSMKLKK